MASTASQNVRAAGRAAVVAGIERVGPAGEVLPDADWPWRRTGAASPAPSTAGRPRSVAMRRWPVPWPWPSAPRRSPRRRRAGAPGCLRGPARAWRRTTGRSSAGGDGARCGAKQAHLTLDAVPPGPQARSRSPGSRAGPPIRSASTAASSVPTMSTAELRLRQEEPLRDPCERFGEGALARSGRAHADARTPSPSNPGPAPTSSSPIAAPPNRSPTRAHARRRQTAPSWSTSETLNTLRA